MGKFWKRYDGWIYLVVVVTIFFLGMARLAHADGVLTGNFGVGIEIGFRF